MTPACHCPCQRPSVNIMLVGGSQLLCCTYVRCPLQAFLHTAARSAVCALGFGGQSCSICPVGSFSPGGTAAVPQPGCQQCPANATTAATGAGACTGERVDMNEISIVWFAGVHR